VIAWRRQNYGWYVLSGLLLGAALLSKYFALFTACAILAHVSFSRHDQQRWRALFMIAFCAMPAAIYHLMWNSQNGWVNFLFNLQNRNEDTTFSLQTALLYLLSITYLLTPFLSSMHGNSAAALLAYFLRSQKCQQSCGSTGYHCCYSEFSHCLKR